MQPAFAPDFAILVDDSYANPDATESMAAPMLIDVGCELCGNIVASGDVLVYGQVKGDISAQASRVFIMQSGRVDGTIMAQGILIDGQLVGSCTAECLVVRKTGEVKGTVKSARLILESGGRLLGQSEHMPASSDHDVRYVVDFLTSNTKNLPTENAQSAIEPIEPPAEITHATVWQLRSWRLSLLLAAITLLVCGIALLLPQEGSEALIREVVLPQVSPPPAPPVAAKRPAMPATLPAAPAAQPVAPQVAMPSVPRSAAGQDLLMQQPIPRYKKASSTAPLSEGDWLAALADWQSQALNVLIKTSTRTRKSNQTSVLKPLTAQTAQLLIQTHKLQSKYTAQHTVNTSPALSSKGLNEQALKRQYQQELTTLLAQANDAAYHTDSQQLIAALRELTK